jgi:pilus assembly protein Flp/PilA
MHRGSVLRGFSAPLFRLYSEDTVRRFLVYEDGPTAVEYAVMLALILVACITIVTSLGQAVSGTFSTINNSMS